MSVLAAINALKVSLKSPITYRIVGPTVDRAYRQSLEDYAVAHGLNVEFPGEVSDRDLPAIY